MRITKLPKAKSLTDSDITLVVQDGETRQIPRKLLTPNVPDGITADGGVLQLTADGTPIGAGAPLPDIPDDLRIENSLLQLTADGNPIGGVQLPESPPWAKQITYRKADLGDKLSVSVSKFPGTGTAMLTVSLSCAKYTRTDTQITAVTPLLSAYRGFTLTADPNDDYRTAAALSDAAADIAEQFTVEADGETLNLSFAELETVAKESGAAEVLRAVECMTDDTSYSDGVCRLVYAYAFRFAEGDTETLNAFCDELLSLIENGYTAFTVRYSEITYIENAEVLANE